MALYTKLASFPAKVLMARSVVLRVFPPVSYVLCDSQGSVELGDTEPVLLRAKRLAKYAFVM